jgi:acyl-CoA thioesterase
VVVGTGAVMVDGGVRIEAAVHDEQGDRSHDRDHHCTQSPMRDHRRQPRHRTWCTLDAMAEFTESPDHPFADLVGFEVTVVEPGIARAALDVGPEHQNPNGVPHGAVLFALVDTSMGGATMSVLPEGRFCASIEVHLRFLRPAFGRRLVAETRVVRAGKRIVHLESRVDCFDRPDSPEPDEPDDDLVASATGSFAVLGGEPRS